MKDGTYYFPSKIGKFFIRYNKELDRWNLGMGEEIYGNYDTADDAADDVYCHATGCHEWDSLDGKVKNVPDSVSDWDLSA